MNNTTELKKPKLSEEMQESIRDHTPKFGDYSNEALAFNDGYRNSTETYLPKVQAIEAEIDALKKQNERLKDLTMQLFLACFTKEFKGDYNHLKNTCEKLINEGLLK